MSTYSSTSVSFNTTSSTATLAMNTITMVSVTKSSANNTTDMTPVTSTTSIATTGKETAAVYVCLYDKLLLALLQYLYFLS